MNIAHINSYFDANKANVNPVYTPIGEKNGSLGTNTESASTPDFKGLENSRQSRQERYELQDTAADLLTNERVCGCLKSRIDSKGSVGVRYNESRKKAHYSNLQRCGSVWTCAVCGTQISEIRRNELKQGIDEWTGQGGAVYLLTLTNPHHYGDALDELLSGQSKALKYLWSDRKPKEMLNALGKIGHITATEVTHGDNGWHPHYHILLFFKKPINYKSLQTFIAQYWQHCCKKAGLKIPSITHGCDIQDGTYASKYVAKWGLECEMTKGHIKKGNDGGLTPWDLLRLARNGDEVSGRLFQIFAKAFKGKRQLSWTKGLKNLLLLVEKTDEELATETEKDSVEVASLSLEQWYLIRRYRMRSDYLDFIEDDILTGGSRASSLLAVLSRYHIDETLAAA